jgi:electron transport complex protein RnfD
MTTLWAAPLGLQDIGHASFLQTLSAIFAEHSVDGFTMATPLDSYKFAVADSTQTEILARPEFQQQLLPGWFWVNIGYLIGGSFLIWKRIITWHTPVAMLSSLLVLSLLFSWDADTRVPMYMHLFGGATMLGAFFITTDPASGATSNKGKLFYGAGIGVLVYLIRTFGNYPDAIAFAVLLMNFAAPLIDHYTRPRVYGHEKSVKGYRTSDQEHQE